MKTMTQLRRLEMSSYRFACKRFRDEWEGDLETATFAERREMYRDEVASRRHVYMRPRDATYADHLAALSTAARAAYLDGATRDQVERLADLYAKAGEFSPYSGGRLTKAEASRLISSF